MLARIAGRLQRRALLGNLRHLQACRADQVDFSSNDYLGIARCASFADLVREKWDSIGQKLNGFGSTGSRCLSGNSALAEEVEEQIAAFHGMESALLFNCGYMANAALLSAVASEGDQFIYDAHVHASMKDGMTLSRAKSYPFRHNDLDHLERRLNAAWSTGERFVVVESIYSTDGTKAPLLQISNLCQRFGAHLIVDEAHAVGVWGPHGQGLVAAHGLEKSIFAQVVTFGKALGIQGAAVLASPTLKQALVNFATPFVYTTAMPGLSMAAVSCSYALLPTLEAERSHLRRLIALCDQSVFQPSESQIQAIPMPGNEAARQAALKLSESGFDVRPLLSPTVQKGAEILRVCLHAYNTAEELIRLKLCVKGLQEGS